MPFQVTRFVHNVSCSTAIFINFLLVTIIAKKTPSNLRTYSIVLLNFSCIETVTAIASMLTFNRTMDAEGYMLNDFTGLCKIIGSRDLCIYSLSFMIHGHSQYCLLIGFSFCYRYYVIRKSSPPIFQLMLCLALFYTPTMLVYLLFSTAPQLGSEELREIMAVVYPDFDYDSRAEFFLGAEMKGRTLLGVLWIQCAILPVYATTITTSILVNKLLKTNLKMSENSKKTHREIMKGLLVQSLMPNLYFFAVGYAIAKEKGLVEDWDEAGHISVMIGSVILATSPFITIYFIKPYREVVRSLLSGYTVPVVTKISLSDGTQRKLTVHRKETTQL